AGAGGGLTGDGRVLGLPFLRGEEFDELPGQFGAFWVQAGGHGEDVAGAAVHLAAGWLGRDAQASLDLGRRAVDVALDPRTLEHHRGATFDEELALAVVVD